MSALPLLILCACGVLMSSARADAQRAPAPSRLEAYVGPSAFLLLGPVSGQASLALDATIQGQIRRPWFWTAGARLDVSPLAPEMFGRISAQPRFGAWSPGASFELGLTARGLEDQGDRLLMELREISRRELAPLYVAIHCAPLRFRASPEWRLSFVELSVGTHVSPLGRYLRFQLLLAAVGIAL
jgi:hypothetical protein